VRGGRAVERRGPCREQCRRVRTEPALRAVGPPTRGRRAVREPSSAELGSISGARPGAGTTRAERWRSEEARSDERCQERRRQGWGRWTQWRPSSNRFWRFSRSAPRDVHVKSRRKARWEPGGSQEKLGGSQVGARWGGHHDGWDGHPDGRRNVTAARRRAAELVRAAAWAAERAREGANARATRGFACGIGEEYRGGESRRDVQPTRWQGGEWAG
jgi:hypothetical protein